MKALLNVGVVCSRNEDDGAKEATYALVTVPRDGAQVGKGLTTIIVDEV